MPLTSPLTTAPLGRSGMELSRVGPGTWAQGGGGWAAGWGPQDDRQSEAAIRHAAQAGINWVDTSTVRSAAWLIRSLPTGTIVECPINY